MGVSRGGDERDEFSWAVCRVDFELNSLECKILVDKITNKLRHWTARMLTYAGKVELIRSVVSGCVNYWAQVFIIPKKVSRTVDSVCRSFLWSNVDSGRRALVSWDDICLPRSWGGLNLKNLIIWNQATQMKLLWCLASKSNRLWIRWIQSYYMKGVDVLNCSTPITASSYYKKLLKVANIVRQHGGWAKFLDRRGSFSARKAYLLMLPTYEKVTWCSLFKHNLATPRALFTVWVALLNKLNTLTKVREWKEDLEVSCRICGQEN